MIIFHQGFLSLNINILLWVLYLLIIIMYFADMNTRKYISIPVIPNFANLVVFPVKQNVSTFLFKQ